MTNPNGTIVNMTSFNRVLWLDSAGRTVSVEPGITLGDLHDHLARKGWEISFSPEIGDATVGSLCVMTSKDSSVQGPGFLAAVVKMLTYVDEKGQLQTMERGAAQLEAFSGSWGVMGIVVAVTLEIRPLMLVSTELKILQYDPRSPHLDRSFARTLLSYKARSDNLFLIIDPSSGYAFVELRTKKTCSPEACLKLHSSPLNKAILGILQRLKFDAFLYGQMPAGLLRLLGPFTRGLPITVFHHRRELVNRYPTVTRSDKRLDFSYYEFQDNMNLDTFVDNVAAVLQFVRQHAAATGFWPGGLASYFVARPGDKHYGSYRGPHKGISYMIDPVTGNPDDPKWLSFLIQLNTFMHKQGQVKFSLSQTRLITPQQLAEQGGLTPRWMAKPRFTTPFLEQFLTES
eukprot:gene9417-9582_t